MHDYLLLFRQFIYFSALPTNEEREILTLICDTSHYYADM